MVAISATNSFIPQSFAIAAARPVQTAEAAGTQTAQRDISETRGSETRGSETRGSETRGGPAVSTRSLISPDLTLALQAENDNGGSSSNPFQRSDAEQAQIESLRARDREVRAHERAHAAAGAGIAGAPSFTYQRGPDGIQYAVEGEVAISTSTIPGDTSASIAKLEQVIRAANAPAEPSSQDRAVAAQARAQLTQLRADALAENRAEQSGESEEDEGTLSDTLDADQAASQEASAEIVNLLGLI